MFCVCTPKTLIPLLYRNSVEEEVIGGIKPNCYARVNPDGRVQVSRRMRVKTKFSLNDHITKRYGFTIASCEFVTAQEGLKKTVSQSHHFSPNRWLPQGQDRIYWEPRQCHNPSKRKGDHWKRGPDCWRGCGGKQRCHNKNWGILYSWREVQIGRTGWI